MRASSSEGKDGNERWMFRDQLAIIRSGKNRIVFSDDTVKIDHTQVLE